MFVLISPALFCLHTCMSRRGGPPHPTPICTFPAPFPKQPLLLLQQGLSCRSKVGICSALPPKEGLILLPIAQGTWPTSDAEFIPELKLLVLILKPETAMCLNSREMTEWKCSHLITSHIQITLYANLAITSKVIVKAMQSNSLLWLPSIMGGKNLSAENLLRGKNESLYLF